MSTDSAPFANPGAPLDLAAETLLRVPPRRRPVMVEDALAFRPSLTFEDSFEVGPLRAALADFWTELTRQAVPIRALRNHFVRGSDSRTIELLSSLAVSSTPKQLVDALAALIGHLAQAAVVGSPCGPSLFDVGEAIPSSSNTQPYSGEVVADLRELVAAGRKFSTIYADPPWAYDNEASRGAAVNHYPTMSVDAICREPIADLAAQDAHLHLWTTNAFLREAFEVIDAWGFCFKSCFVWIKDDIGMGNYWRVSHEFLLLGVRGRLRFRDCTEPSWKLCRRTVHSRKPEAVRLLVEKVSPGPYLELYGRSEMPSSPWTVYGNQVERRLF